MLMTEEETEEQEKEEEQLRGAEEERRETAMADAGTRLLVRQQPGDDAIIIIIITTNLHSANFAMKTHIISSPILFSFLQSRFSFLRRNRCCPPLQQRRFVLWRNYA
jgi:hypothetical protein